jgi:hypothetical protein
MEDFINCSVCKKFLLEGQAYAYVYREPDGDIRLYYGHKYCLNGLQVEHIRTKKLLVHPAAFNKNDPLYIGYVGDKRVGKENEL